MDELQAKYEEMASKRKGKQFTFENLLHSINLPFTNKVMKFSLLEKFKVPQIKMNDGSRNPTEYIETY